MEIMPFAATWMTWRLSVILNELKSDRERETSLDMRNLKRNDTNELIYQTETDSQT